MNLISTLNKALRAKYQGEIEAAKANIEVYIHRPAGIGEHSDIIGAIDEQIGIMASAKEKLEALKEIPYLEETSNKE